MMNLKVKKGSYMLVANDVCKAVYGSQILMNKIHNGCYYPMGYIGVAYLPLKKSEDMVLQLVTKEFLDSVKISEFGKEKMLQLKNPAYLSVYGVTELGFKVYNGKYYRHGYHANKPDKSILRSKLEEHNCFAKQLQLKKWRATTEALLNLDITAKAFSVSSTS